ncbi:hypothetical protein ACS5PN_17805 [Roseateles sp. NT4]|uniref:hypothetical protein n=1 Tax=Roseateles sp. NT4 TaxID=3453715 RepID=UPI003EEDA56E
MQEQLLQTLHEIAPGGEPVALTRLAKRLDERVSVLLRELNRLTDASIGGVVGPGWLAVEVDESGRWTARLTEAGRRYLSEGSVS